MTDSHRVIVHCNKHDEDVPCSKCQEKDSGRDGIPTAGYRHDFEDQYGDQVIFHSLKDNIPDNPRGKISELVTHRDALEYANEKEYNGVEYGIEKERKRIKALIQAKIDKEKSKGIFKQKLGSNFGKDLLEELEQ